MCVCFFFSLSETLLFCINFFTDTFFFFLPPYLAVPSLNWIKLGKSMIFFRHGAINCIDRIVRKARQHVWERLLPTVRRFATYWMTTTKRRIEERAKIEQDKKLEEKRVLEEERKKEEQRQEEKRAKLTKVEEKIQKELVEKEKGEKRVDLQTLSSQTQCANSNEIMIVHKLRCLLDDIEREFNLGSHKHLLEYSGLLSELSSELSADLVRISSKPSGFVFDSWFLHSPLVEHSFFSSSLLSFCCNYSYFYLCVFSLQNNLLLKYLKKNQVQSRKYQAPLNCPLELLNLLHQNLAPMSLKLERRANPLIYRPAHNQHQKLLILK